MPKCLRCGEDINLTPEYRYANDQMFRSVVDVLVGLIESNQLTPVEIREAANHAAYRHECLKTARWHQETMRPIKY